MSKLYLLQSVVFPIAQSKFQLQVKNTVEVSLRGSLLNIEVLHVSLAFFK